VRSEKELLLEAYDSRTVEENNFGWRYLLMTLLILGIVLMVLFPKIYLRSQIYYKSRDIATLTREYRVLKEENAVLKTKVEAIRFKHQVIDTMFDE